MPITVRVGRRFSPSDDAFVLGVTEPRYYNEDGVQSDDGPFAPPMAASTDVGIAGVKPGVTRSNYSGSINWSTPQTLENLNFTGDASVSLRNITGTGHRIRNCKALGYDTQQWPSGGGGVIQTTDASCSDIEFEHVTIRPTYPNDRWDGFYGHDFIAYRCLIERTVDAWSFVNQHAPDVNAYGRGCWAGNLSWYDDDRGVHGDGTHNDILQQHSGTGGELDGCAFWGYKWNALNPTNSGGGTTPLAFDSGWNSNRNPQIGQVILTQTEAYYHSQGLTVKRFWLYGGYHAIKVAGQCSISGHSHRFAGNPTIIDGVFMNDDQVDFTNNDKLYPFRADGTDVQINGDTLSTWGDAPTTVPSDWNVRFADRSSADRKQNVASGRRGQLVFGRI